jgi:hypothetical protein
MWRRVSNTKIFPSHGAISVTHAIRPKIPRLAEQFPVLGMIYSRRPEDKEFRGRAQEEKRGCRPWRRWHSRSERKTGPAANTIIIRVVQQQQRHGCDSSRPHVPNQNLCERKTHAGRRIHLNAKPAAGFPLKEPPKWAGRFLVDIQRESAQVKVNYSACRQRCLFDSHLTSCPRQFNSTLINWD